MNYELETIKERLRDYVESITTKGRGDFYICPFCHSGTGHNHTAAFSISKDGKRWKCFSCNAHNGGGDIFDLIGEVENIKDFPEQLKRAKDFLGISDFKEEYQNQYKTERKADTPAPMQEEEEEKEIDISSFTGEAHLHITETDYPQSRGLTEETINRFNLGYVKEWTNPKVPNSTPSPRLIIPTSIYSYTARDTREDALKRYIKVGKVHFLNGEILTTSTRPIFITEGELNALSIIQAGGEAIALGSTAEVPAFLRFLKKNRPTQPLILAMDNDPAGDKALGELGVGLQELEIPCYRGQEAAGSYNDANEYLMKDSEGFTAKVKELTELPYNIMEEERKKKLEEYSKKSAREDLDKFWDGLFEVDTPYIPTGFNSLDTLLDGGLYEGLYIIGSVSSAGKTTFTLQVADQIAKHGEDVLIFSLEMSRNELIAKSISRLTYDISMDRSRNSRNAKTTRRITTRKFWDSYSDTELEIIYKAIDRYAKYAGNIYIEEGAGDVGIEEIKARVEEHIEITGRKPIVFIDYLQILKPFDVRSTDKQNTDKAVLELKKLSRKHKLSIIAISSFNRASYKGEAQEQAFKESGAIEYSSDVLLGLQFKGAAEKNFSLRKAKKKRERNMELAILKNRNGQAGSKVAYKYYTLFNCFEDQGIVEEKKEDNEEQVRREEDNWKELSSSFT